MEDVEQADYLREIADLQRKLVELQENEAAPALIEEYSVEVRILVALLDATKRLVEDLQSSPELASSLTIRGFQPTQFRELYAFVYEAALEIDLAGAEFARAVERTDFSTSLRSGNPRRPRAYLAPTQAEQVPCPSSSTRSSSKPSGRAALSTQLETSGQLTSKVPPQRSHTRCWWDSLPAITAS